MESSLRFDRIVGNPPYVSLKKLPPQLRRSALSIIDFSDKPIGKSANIWYAFVIASMRLLRDGGSLAFVLPSAAEFANYSSALRESIGGRFGSLQLYRSDKPLFESVQEGSVVAIARDFNSQPCRIRRQQFDSKTSLIKGLNSRDISIGRRCPSVSVAKRIPTVKLRSLAKIRLGGVTGSVGYFLMNEERRLALRLPISAMTRVVSKAKHLKSSILDQRYWNELRFSQERIWLFNPPDNMTEYESVKEYLNLDPVRGGCDRRAYKISHRSPWYRTALPFPCDAFLSGMSQSGPWICINETRNLNATNTLYVVTFLSRSRTDWLKCGLSLLTSYVQKQMRKIERRYADGLIKFEPGEIGELELPIVRDDVDHRSLYVTAVNALLAGNSLEARNVANSALH